MDQLPSTSWRGHVIAILALALLASSAAAQARKSKRAEPVESPFAIAMRQQIEREFENLLTKQDWPGSVAAFEQCFDQVVAIADVADKALWRDAAFSLRMVQQLAATESGGRLDRLRYLRANPRVARALVFTIKPDEEKVNDVYLMFDQLRAVHGPILDQYAQLAAAISVVHEDRLVRRINENRATSPDPLALFEYFMKNQKKLYFGVQDVPAELLIYVVDATSSIPELQWALQRYAGHRNVGSLFFDVEYDFDHLEDGDAKKVTKAGWSLPNILKFGGVCADQAYFAVTVGKAIGVPTTYTTGKSSEVGHAWVGFLQAENRRGGGALWNFDSGRYEAYQGVRGIVQDPQTRKSIPDSYVALLADFVNCAEVDRQYASAMADASQRLQKIIAEKKPFAPSALEGVAHGEARPANIATILHLLESGLSAAPGHAQGWLALQHCARAGQLSGEDKTKWEGVLYRLCGQRYPDFYLAVLTPMIATIENVQEQNAMWNAAFTRFEKRPDLAAAVRMEQAEMWEKQNDLVKAGQCYEDVINRFANAGPFVIQAVVQAEEILKSAGQANRVPLLYQRAWSQIRKPQSDMAPTFARQSNWYRVGKMYAERLQQAGMGRDAEKVEEVIALR